MQKLQFYGLQRPIQERFIESTRGTGAPVALLYQPPTPNYRALGYAIGAASLFALCCLLARLGFGDLNHRFALNPSWVLFVYCGLLCAALLALLTAVLIWNREGNVPFRRGIYGFPSGVIDARSPALEVHPLSELLEVTSTGSGLRLRFSDGTMFDFRGVNSSRGEQIKAALLEAQQRVSAPPGELSNRDQALLDPLVDTGFKNPFSPPESMRPWVPLWTKRWLLFALAAGVASGIGLWKLRNLGSAERLYSKARTLNTIPAYQAYLARGGVKPDVRDVLLPEAELRDAQSAHTVEAIERFIEGHPNSKIGGKIEGALRAALLRELDTARASGSVAALRDFRSGDPQVSLVKPELEAAQHALYRGALTRYQTMSRNSPGLIAFFERLLAYAEQHGPQVEIRFRRRVPDSVQNADSRVQKSAYFSGPSALPAQYFDAAHSEPRETLIAATISKRFADVFARDILTFALASVLADDGGNVPTVTAPTLLITHRTEMSAAYTSRKPRGVFVGLGLMFKAQLLIPGDSAPLAFQSSSWLPPDLKKLDQEGWGPAELYEAMAQEGFSQFLKKYQAWLFRGVK